MNLSVARQSWRNADLRRLLGVYLLNGLCTRRTRRERHRAARRRLLSVALRAQGIGRHGAAVQLVGT